MLTREALLAVLHEPQFSFLTSTDRDHLIGSIFAICKDVNELAGDAQDAVAILNGSIIDLAERAGIISDPGASIADVLESLAAFIDDANSPTIPAALAVCPHDNVTITNAGSHYCQDCGEDITPAAAPAPTDPTPAPSDPAPAP